MLRYNIGMFQSQRYAGIRPWHALSVLFLLLAGGTGGAAWYGYERLAELNTHVAELDGALASTTVTLEADMAKANATLAANFSSTLEAQNQNVASVTSAVSTLEKLQNTDPQLLAKYSKIYFLNENYIPSGLAEIPTQYLYFDNKTMQILPQVLPRLTAMLDNAKEQGITLYVYSAYRSFDTQVALKSQYKVTFGAGTAGSFSADQGYSEHQLGTAVDLITTGIGGQLDSTFANTTAFQWLVLNAYKYGFILSYPPGNSYYIYEPWHWRFVGVKLATDLHNEQKYFYDLDQRTIDTYLGSLFD